MATMRVGVVSPERQLWTGDAQAVYARTTTGEIGILPGHIPVLGVLAEGGVVRVTAEGGEDVRFAVHSGFLSVSDDGVSVLAELAEAADEIDTSRAQAALDRAEEGSAAQRRARARLAAAGSGV